MNLLCGGRIKYLHTVIKCCYFCISGLLGCRAHIVYLVSGTVSLNPGLGGVRGIVYAIISHEQTQPSPSSVDF